MSASSSPEAEVADDLLLHVNQNYNVVVQCDATTASDNLEICYDEMLIKPRQLWLSTAIW